MLEQAIDIQLDQMFSKEEIGHFYQCFPNDYKVYNHTNSDVVEALYGYIDFE